MKPRTSHLLAGLVFASVHAICNLPAQAVYPERPVRFIVPSAPGGAPDINVRIIVTEVGRQMGQQFVVDNRPGAAGSIGTDLIAKAPPDGYTIGTGNIATLAINRSVLPKLPYHPDKLQPVVQWTFVPNLLAVSLSLPVNSVQELIDYGRKNPGKLNFGSAGAGTSIHLSGELFKLMTGARIVHVPFKGSSFAITDLTAGRVHLMFDNIPSIGPHMKTGRLRGLAVTTAKRVPAYSELPTVTESGVPGFAVTSWGGVIVPGGVSKAIVARLNAEVNKALAAPHVREKLTSLGSEVVGGTPEQFADHIRKETAKWADVVKRAGITFD
jgi:tripartite-type tricarboxylate transporter receptor subunit TctC